MDYYYSYITLDLVAWIIILVLVIFFLFAWYQERSDFIKFNDIINAVDNRTLEEKLEYYGCYVHDGYVRWRNLYMSAFIGALLMIFVFLVFGIPFQPALFVLSFAVIAIPSYIISQWTDHHLQREICLKCKASS